MTTDPLTVLSHTVQDSFGATALGILTVLLLAGLCLTVHLVYRFIDSQIEEPWREAERFRLTRKPKGPLPEGVVRIERRAS